MPFPYVIGIKLVIKLLIFHNCKYELNLGSLLAKYPWQENPHILINNGNAIFLFQKKLETKQLKEGTFSQYVLCFQNMIDREVVS